MKQLPRCEHCGHVLAAPLRSRTLSPRERHLLDYLQMYVEASGCAPTHGEILQALAVKSTAHVHELLAKLERKGYVSVTPRVRRGIALIPQPETVPQP